jgi:hypothetical protein
VGVLSKTDVLHMLRISFSIFVIVVSQCFTCLAGGNDDAIDPMLSRSVASALKKSKAEAGKITLPVTKDDDEGVKAAKEMVRKFHSPEFQDKIKQEQQRLTREVVKECGVLGNKHQSKADEEERSISKLSDSDKIYLFLSSSMPDETVHNYLSLVSLLKDPHLRLVMRGMTHGLADRTANTQYFSRILKEDLDCRDTAQPCARFKTNILFKPSLFAKYEINQVPVLVYDNGEDIFVIKGDAGLGYLLGRINHQLQSKNLAGLIRKIEGHLF